MSTILGAVRHTLDHAKQQVQVRAQEFADSHGVETKYVDVTFQFIGASGIPKMDVVGTADPYFIATLDNNLKFVYVRAAPDPEWHRADLSAGLPCRSTRSAPCGTSCGR